MHILTNSARGFGRALALTGLTLLAAFSLGGCSANRGAAPTQLDLGAGVATPRAALPANPAAPRILQTRRSPSRSPPGPRCSTRFG